MRVKILSVLLLSAAAVLAAAAAPAQDLADFESRLTEHHLDNGLTFLILERPEAPVVSFFTHVDVGSCREQYGTTGLAHMFEHMAFKGTSRIGSKDHAAESEALGRLDEAYAALARESARHGGGDPEEIKRLEEAFRQAQEEAAGYVAGEAFTRILEQAGSTGLNAFTSADTTGYMVSLPANKVELWAYMESERFRDPVFREFYKERAVVQEERRMRTESQPFGRLMEEVQTTAFKAHPYGHPIVGHMSDLKSFTRADAWDFYHRYYVPSNMVIAIVGDVKAKSLIPMLEAYFGRLPGGEEPEPLRTVEPPQVGERNVRVEEVSQPIYMAAYHRPSGSDEEAAAVDALADLLGSGRTSRLYTRLVKEEKVASFAGVFSGYPGDKYPTLLMVFAIPSKGHTAEEVGALVDEEIEKVRTTPAGDAEISRIKTRSRADFIRSLDGNMGLAVALADWETRTGDWRDLFRYLDRMEKISPEEIMRVAGEYLEPGNRTVGMLVTAEAEPHSH